MKVTLDRINDDFLFDAKGASNVSVHIDSKVEDVVNGASPMELLLMAVGGCNAIDIVSILKKQRQEITGYHIDVEGRRKEVRQAKPFEAIHVNIHLEGKVDPAKAKRAAQLSFEKYCSVSITLEGSVEVTYEVYVNGEKV
ncbi:MAG: OsmC family protein [Bacteroidia bacterium]|nr:OsmC family protein [Bacteroidia bacterium]NNF31592.1 OsmC family protein [Flavobacteriaceae bacterium]MBT8275250.1 OsmC family protein [Bacteroidia bacterium]NNJ82727.1 OsmC family protein [Flavobacteriaceae bacterium]NNK53282.1 OsmC family protein [Flavobacteriaceae bacterium]